MTVTDGPVTGLEEYAGLPIAFTVRTVLGSDGAEVAVEPWLKDYDALDGGPLSWPDRFELEGWRLFTARTGARLVGGAAVSDAGWLWDLRVRPDSRGQGVGRALFEAAAAWARARGYVRLMVETQDVNVPACRFYERMGCRLDSAEPGAYPGLPGETRLVWHLELF